MKEQKYTHQKSQNSDESQDAMNQPKLLDVFGISLDEILAMRDFSQVETFGVKGCFARLLTTMRTQDSGAYIADQLWECKQILSKVGLHLRIDLTSQPKPTRATKSACVEKPVWEQILERIYCDPVAIRNRVVWLFFHACLQAERKFSLEVCPAHSREDILTGKLLGEIKAACAAWATASSSFLARCSNVLELSSIDLTIGGREQETGGDFALILDITEDVSCAEDLAEEVIALTGGPKRNIFVPLIFQAKCYTGEDADISQKHKTRGYQFNRLRQSKCASSFIFYENGKDPIEFPVLPMVKLTSDCSAIEISRTTSVFDQSVNLATYILRALNGFDNIPTARTREDALNMILANTSPDEIIKISILGNTSDLENVYRVALQRLSSEFTNEMHQALSEDDDHDDDPKSGFRPK